MNTRTFLDNRGSFELKGVEQHTGLYFPLASEVGIKTAIAPDLGGDAKLDQNHFLYAPSSIENLHNDRGTRNFWANVEGKGAWSLTGGSAAQRAKKFSGNDEEVTVQAGYMWHKTIRESAEFGIKGEILSFIPVKKNVEIHQVTIENISDETVTLTGFAAFPIYGRSADNIRDHRHVTSLLHRIKVTEDGVVVNPTLSFDERGHQVNDTIYFVNAVSADDAAKPESFFPEVATYIGEGGSYDMPEAVIRNLDGVKAGYSLDGQEAIGAMKFAKATLKPGEKAAYIVTAGICNEESEIEKLSGEYKDTASVEKELEAVKEYWLAKVNVSYHTGDEEFDQFMNWVSFQPELRRVFGCSFLPHHDYGKGGRGWRDLWQDCLALLIMNPDGVREMLLGNFAGVRMDGSNATIIGEKQGEFKADRNSITRVWMDHGVWPLMTTKLYINQTGDIELLDEKIKYFKDRQVCRGKEVDTLWNPDSTWQKDLSDAEYEGTVLEHLLVQNLTAFWEVGEHNNMRLRDADWNDALDMARTRGESVAFTNAYAKNLLDLADLIDARAKRAGGEGEADSKVADFEILEEMLLLLTDDASLYDSVEKKNALLGEYMAKCVHSISGNKVKVSAEELATSLRNKANWVFDHLRKNEWVEDGEGNGWFNSYYDDNGRRVEGVVDGKVRMMITGQVFSIMAGTAEKNQVEAIVKSADKYLYDENCGGYRLNTDFGEVKTDMGRMFGFAFGEKENGAVFSHMAVMFGNALYTRGFAKEGYKSLKTLYKQSMNMDVSHIFPGIPEYFGRNGRGLYNYLTGAGSWYMMTVVNEMFGVKGSLGALVVDPKLMKEQFDAEGCAGISLNFAGIDWKIEYENKSGKEYGEYGVIAATLDGDDISASIGTCSKRGVGYLRISQDTMAALDKNVQHVVKVTLG